MSYFILTIYNLSTSPCVNSSIGLLVLVTGVHRENHWPAASRWQLYHIMLYRIHLDMSRMGSKLTILVVICTDCIRNCKSNYFTIMTLDGSLKQKVMANLYTVHWVAWKMITNISKNIRNAYLIFLEHFHSF
jgi:hypothetical protein